MEVHNVCGENAHRRLRGDSLARTVEAEGHGVTARLREILSLRHSTVTLVV